jgi:hypothetical protein
MRACKRDGDVCHAKKQEILFFFEGKTKKYQTGIFGECKMNTQCKLIVQIVDFFFFKLLMLIC